MNCPQCSAKMHSGLVVVKMTSGLVPLLAGSGTNYYQHLWFVSPDVADTHAVRMATIDGSGDIVLRVGQAGTAERCPSCGLIALMKADVP